jgi:hypothetical protein
MEVESWPNNMGEKLRVIANLFRNTLGTSGTTWELGWNTFGIEPNKYSSTTQLWCKTRKKRKKLSLSKPSLLAM